MGREYWRPSNMLYPLPAVMVSCADENGKVNVMTAAWTGTVCSDPVMVYVSIRPSRFSHDIIERTGEFVINLTTRKLVRETDYVGVRSGRDEDKLEAMHLHASPSVKIKAPGIAESPVSLECQVTQILRLGSHDMFLAKVLSTDIDPQYLDQNGKFDLDRADLIAYSHGEYRDLGKILGSFGFSVRKNTSSQRNPGRKAGIGTGVNKTFAGTVGKGASPDKRKAAHGKNGQTERAERTK